MILENAIIYSELAGYRTLYTVAHIFKWYIFRKKGKWKRKYVRILMYLANETTDYFYTFYVSKNVSKFTSCKNFLPTFHQALT